MPEIKLAVPDLAGAERKYLLEAFDSTFISSTGEFVEKFEKEFAKFTGTRFATTVSNGTTALHLILQSLGVNGKEVIVPSLTFGASAASAFHAGGKPVLVDCGPDWNISPQEVKKAITPKTAAIMAVHLYGQPAMMDELRDIAQAEGVELVEDCAEALGAEYKSKKVGALGAAGAFSFFGNKVITTGEGGMVTTDNEELYEKLVVIKNHGMTKQKRYWHNVIGYNFRMTNLQAAVGCGQLERVEEIIKKRDAIQSWYDDMLDTKNFTLQQNFSGRKKVCWLYPVLAKNERQRDEAMQLLEKEGVESRKFFFPLHEMPPYLQTGQFANSIAISRRGLILPCHTALAKKDVEFICKIVNTAKE